MRCLQPLTLAQTPHGPTGEIHWILDSRILRLSKSEKSATVRLAFVGDQESDLKSGTQRLRVRAELIN